MGELGDVLELLHGARGRYRTARGVLRQRSDLRLAEQARERWERQRREAGRSVGTMYAFASGGGPQPERPGEHEVAVRFWWQPPDRLREESLTLAPDRYEHVNVRDGTRWWTYSPEWGAMSNVVAGDEAEDVSAGGGETWAPLLDPSVWMAALDFEVAGETTALARPALRVDAVPRVQPGGDPFFFQAQLPVGADSYRLLVDLERGVVLRVAAVLDAAEFWLGELEELAFDEDFPPETFVFEPPPGEELRGPDVGLHEPVPIEEAARRASFPVFFLPGLPPGRWDLHVMYAAARKRPRIAESVFLAYHRVDATHQVTITERAAGERPDEWGDDLPGEAAEVERDGLRLTVHRPGTGWSVPLTVRLEREGRRSSSAPPTSPKTCCWPSRRRSSPWLPNGAQQPSAAPPRSAPASGRPRRARGRPR